jgi:hypothetical protein
VGEAASAEAEAHDLGSRSAANRGGAEIAVGEGQACITVAFMVNGSDMNELSISAK